MKEIKCDVLVVGGGPAGSSAARSAALNGLKIIQIEKKEEIGIDVKCGEGIGEYLIPFLPFEIPKEQLIWKIDGMFFWTDDIIIEKKGKLWNAYSINRSKFDKWLSDLALGNGVELLLNTELIDLELNEENKVKKAILKRKEKLFEISPKTIIAADGSESTVLKLLDLYNPKIGDLAEVYSWELKNLDLYKPHFEQIFTGDFTPSGYAYIFPKGKDVANVGIGGIFQERKMETYFEKFLEIDQVKKQVKNAEKVIEKSKKAVWNNLSDKWIYGNVILAGDVANQNLKPFIEGILPSIICGDIAGKIAFEMLIKNNVDNEQYQNEVQRILGTYFITSKEMQESITYLFSKKDKEKYLQFFGMVTELFKAEEMKETENMNYDELKSMLLKLKNEL